MPKQQCIWSVNLKGRPEVHDELTSYANGRDLNRSDVLNQAINLFLEQRVRQGDQR